MERPCAKHYCSAHVVPLHLICMACPALSPFLHGRGMATRDAVIYNLSQTCECSRRDRFLQGKVATYHHQNSSGSDAKHFSDKSAFPSTWHSALLQHCSQNKRHLQLQRYWPSL